MADEIDSSKAELKKIADDVVAARKKEELEKANEARNKEMQEAIARNADNFAVEMAKFRQKRRSVDPQSGKEVSDWDRAMSAANHALEADYTTINDYKSAMMALLSMLGKMVKAGNASVNETLWGLGHYVIEGKITPEGLEAGYGRKLLMAGKSLRSPSIPEEIKIPKLLHDIKVNNQGSLDIHLKRSDDGPLNVQLEQGAGMDLQKGFNNVVKLWLAAQGYKQVDNSGPFLLNGDQNEPLTQSKFDALKSDLDKHLEDNGVLEYQEEPRSSLQP